VFFYTWLVPVPLALLNWIQRIASEYNDRVGLLHFIIIHVSRCQQSCPGLPLCQSVEALIEAQTQPAQPAK
jgi:hypothetical protein